MDYEGTEEIRNAILSSGQIVYNEAEVTEAIERLKKYNQNIEEWSEMFDVYDPNKHGFILTSEVPELVKHLEIKVSDVELGQIIKENDKQHSGFIKKVEFLEVFASYGETFDSQDILEAFKIFDVNTNGFVTDEEIVEALSKYGEKIAPEEAINLMRAIDYDGAIPYANFIKNNSIL